MISCEAKVELVEKFPRELYKLLLRWMDEYPERNFEDSVPRDYVGFRRFVEDKNVKEEPWLVKKDGEPVGYMCFAPIAQGLGSMRGVCFSKFVHGDGTAARAMRCLLQRVFDRGFHKVMCFPFADNHRAISFYKKLGAVEEGHLKHHLFRNGKLIDLKLLSFFSKHDGYRNNDQVRTHDGPRDH